MLNREQYLSLQATFYDIFVSSTSSGNCHLPYDEYIIPSGAANGSQWISFHSLAKDRVRELLNSINQFCTSLQKLESWNRVLNKCNETCRTDLILEIIDPLVSATINSIYFIKQRFIYAAYILLHQTEILIDPEIQDRVFDENEICYETLVNYKSSFSRFDTFIDRLSSIDDYTFRKRTSNYRNLFQHHIPPSVENGSSKPMSRTMEERVPSSLSIGGITPIHINNVMPILHNQHQACTDTFKAFWGLVSEQVLMWKILRPNTP